MCTRYYGRYLPYGSDQGGAFGLPSWASGPGVTRVLGLREVPLAWGVITDAGVVVVNMEPSIDGDSSFSKTRLIYRPVSGLYRKFLSIGIKLLQLVAAWSTLQA
jgi:hypothetical protein